MERAVMLERRRVIISGRVQGVSFREFTRVRAVELGLCGWVRNLADGRVEALIEGESEPVAALLELVKAGPPAARVANIEEEAETPTGDLSTFEIMPGRHS